MAIRVMVTQLAWVCSGAIATGACALKGDVRRLEDQLAIYRQETATADSARAAMLARLIDGVVRSHTESSQILNSLQAELQTLFAMQGAFRGEMTNIQRQLDAIEELTGQSQAGLRELCDQVQRPLIPPATIGAGGGRSEGGQRAQSPEGLFQMGRTQLQRGSPRTARIAFRRVLDEFPEHERAADALYWVGESFRADEPDSAVAAFEQVVETYPNSPRAPAALYKVGLDAERRGDDGAARRTFQRLIDDYPESDEAELARAKLRR